MITNLFTDKPTDMKLERGKNLTCSIFGLNIQSILNLSVNKGIHLLVIGICLSFMVNAQVSKSVISTAGRLAAVLTTAELQTVTDLTISGTIDARDFKAMRDDMPLLAVLDLSEVTITAYSGANGTFSLGNFDFPADEVPYSAFYDSNSVGKYSLTSVVLPKSINSIGKFAFRDCIGITSFIIPGVINSIGDYAFGSCRGLTSFDIPEGTTYIGVLAFEDCSKMTNMKIPSTVRVIGDGAFMSFNGMIVVDANNLKYSSKDGVLFNKNQTALLQCPISKKGNYIIPASVTSIGTYAFYACNKLNSITIPTLVTTIGKAAFVRCTEITSLTIPSSVNSVGPQAFWGCINLLTITSQGVNPCSFGSSFEVFGEVDNTSCILYVPYGTASLYRNASQWQDFTNIIEKTGFYLSSATADIESVPGSVATIDVSANVVWTAGSDQTWLTVSPLNGTGIGQKLTFIADANPLFTERIAKVTVSAPGIESQAITITQNKQSSIKTYEVTPGSISTLSSYDLNNITSLTLTGTIDARDFKTIRDKMPLLAVLDIGGVNIAEYIGSDGTSIWNNNNYPANTIPESAFMDGNRKGKSGLTSIVLPSSMTAFGLYSFGNCSGVTAISIPPSVTNLGNSVFNGCAGLTSVIIPSSVTNTGNSTFAGCKSLTSVNIPSSIITIGESTFGACIGLTSITIPSSVDTIGSSAFTGCTGLTSITIPSSVTSMGSYVFSGCSGLKSFSFPPSITKIESNTFSKCNGLTEITIPSWITIIGESAFNECKSLTTVTILSPKTTLGNWAFGNCTKLSSLTVPWTVPPGLEDYTLSAVNRNTCNLYVPFGTAKLYAADVQWGTFMHIIEYGTGFSLSTNTSKVESAAGSTSTIEVTANINWTASSDQTWLIVSPLSGTGIGQKLTFTADANPLFTSRTATIEVSATGLEPQFVTVTQNAKQDIPVNPVDSTNVGNGYWNDHNLIKNWNFTTDLTYWGGWWDGATQIPPVIQDGVAVMHTDVNADGNNWHYQFSQSGLKAEANVPYILKFKAWSSTARSNGLDFEDAPNNNYNRYGASPDPEAINGRSEWVYNTTTEPEWFTFHVTFDQMNPTTVQKIKWMLSTANATSYLDSVLLIKDGDLPIVNPDYLSLSVTQVNMPDIGAITTVTINSNTHWEAISDQTWLTVSPSAGTGSGMLTFITQTNLLYTPRTATLIVSATGLEPQSITVTQNAKQELPVNPIDSTNVGNGNNDWNDHNLIKNWNFTTDLTYWGGWWDGATQIPPVVQDGVAVMHTDVNADGTNWHYQFSQSGLIAEANVPYILKFKAWSSTARSNGLVFEDTPANSYNRYGASSDPEAINGRSEWIYYTTTEPSWFTFHVTFDQMNPTTVQKIQWLMSMADATAYLDSVLLTKDDDLVTGNPAYLTLDLTQISLLDSEGSATVYITSNTNWAASTDQTWLTVSPSTGSGNGILTVTAEGNSLVTSRNALITVSASGMNPQTMLITQKGKEEPTSEPGDSTQVVVSATQVNLTAKESNAKIDISSNSTCTAISDQSWLIVSPLNGSGNQTLNVKIEPNQTSENRSATVTIYVGGVASQTITITQESVTGIDPILSDKKLAVYPNPTSGKVKIVLNENPPDGTYLIVNDLNGKTILKQFILNKEEYFDLKGNTPGIYIVKTNLKDFKVQKLILK